MPNTETSLFQHWFEGPSEPVGTVPQSHSRQLSPGQPLSRALLLGAPAGRAAGGTVPTPRAVTGPRLGLLLPLQAHVLCTRVPCTLTHPHPQSTHTHTCTSILMHSHTCTPLPYTSTHSPHSSTHTWTLTPALTDTCTHSHVLTCSHTRSSALHTPQGQALQAGWPPPQLLFSRSTKDLSKPEHGCLSFMPPSKHSSARS